MHFAVLTAEFILLGELYHRNNLSEKTKTITDAEFPNVSTFGVLIDFSCSVSPVHLVNSQPSFPNAFSPGSKKT